MNLLFISRSGKNQRQISLPHPSALCKWDPKRCKKNPTHCEQMFLVTELFNLTVNDLTHDCCNQTRCEQDPVYYVKIFQLETAKVILQAKPKPNFTFKKFQLKRKDLHV